LIVKFVTGDCSDIYHVVIFAGRNVSIRLLHNRFQYFIILCKLTIL